MLNSSELLLKTVTATTEIRVQCTACGSIGTRMYVQDAGRRIWRCSECELLFVFPQPTAEQLDREFQESYFREANKLERDFELGRRPVLTQIANEIRRHKSSGNLLDVGCASAELFEYFGNDNWRLRGVEPSRVAFHRAQMRFGSNPRVDLINGYLHDVPLEQTCDVITVLESLYYMSDLRRDLTHINNLLSDDGLLAISVPGSQYQRLRYTGVVSKITGGASCSLTRSHLYYFSPASLAALLASVGFSIVDSVPLVSPEYGSRVGQSVRKAYVATSRILRAVTFGYIDLSLHVLYLCRKAATI